MLSKILNKKILEDNLRIDHVSGRPRASDGQWEVRLAGLGNDALGNFSA